jgi:hypothetical protein
MIKQIIDAIKRIAYALNKLKKGESSKYATLAMKRILIHETICDC